MSPIIEATFYAVECDACGRIQDDGEHSYWGDQDHPLDTVHDNGGIVLNLKGHDILVICEQCAAKYATTFPDYEAAGDSNLVAFDAIHDSGKEPETSAARAWAAAHLAETKAAPAVYREGWDSYHAQGRRRDIGANPYEFGSPKWVAWREGYTDAEGERIKELVDRGL